MADFKDRKDRYKAVGGPTTFGRSGRTVEPSNSVDLNPFAKAVVVTEAGDLSIVPVGNASSEPIAFVGCPVGFIPPFQVRRVMADGTDAGVATVDD